MKRKLLSLFLAALFVLSALPALIVSTSASDPLENLFVKDGFGEPNQTTAGGALKSLNYNFVSGKNIPVSAGDKITVGPIITGQGYHLMAYGSAAVKVTRAGTGVKLTTIGEKTNLEILTYTVQAGVTSVTFVGQPIFEKYYLITKNQEYTPAEFIGYWKAKGLDAESVIGGTTTEVSEIKNVFATGGVYAGRADTSLVSHSSYFCTQGFIEVKPYDVVYFIGDSSQGYQLTLYDKSKTKTTTVNKIYMSQYATLGGAYVLYAYAMRSDTAYLRVTTSAAIYKAGVALATINQPFGDDTYRAWCASVGKSPDALIGSKGAVPYRDLVNLYDKTKLTAGYASADGFSAKDKTFYSDAIAVAAGDVVRFGPVDKTIAVPSIVAYSGNTVKAALKGSELTVASAFDNGLSALSYTVPDGVTSVRINVTSQYSDCVLATKNQLFDRYTYDEWYASTIADGQNLWNPATAIYGGFANASAALNVNKTYNCTAYIPVSQGDKIYVGSLHFPQPQLGVIYKSDRSVISNLSLANFKVEFNISDNTGMLCYTVPANVGYIRFIPRAGMTEYLFISKNTPITKQQYVEKLGVKLPEADTASPLNGKTALFVGDSITFGAGEDSLLFSWPGRLGARTGLVVTNNGDSGARVSTTGTGGFIIDGLKTNKKFDMIVMHGGVNDASGAVPIGAITADGTKTFDQSTYAGGLEAMFYYCSLAYSDSDLFYITNFHLDGRAAENSQRMVEYFALAEKICKKWNVTIIDLYDNNELNSKLNTKSTTYLPDLLHPNGAGYDIITPYIQKALENFYAPQQPEDTGTTVTEPAPVNPTDPTDPADTTASAIPEQTTLPDTTAAPAKKKSCGGIAGVFAAVAALVGICGFAIVRKHF